MYTNNGNGFFSQLVSIYSAKLGFHYGVYIIGVVSLKFKLPKLAKNGVWTLRSKIDNQVNEKAIMVETYYQPLFEVKKKLY